MGYSLQFSDIFRAGDAIALGLLQTLQLTATTFVFGLLLALGFAVLAVYGSPTGKAIARTYVEVLRNTPLIVQLFVLFFGLPTVGIRLTPMWVATIGMIVNMGAYGAEIMRAGLESIPKSQKEAGVALGMSTAQIFRYVILIPAFRNIYPALSSQLILIMLGTSVASQIAAPELFYVGSILQSRTFRDFEVYIVISSIYLGLAVLLRMFFFALRRILFRYP
ncbi:MAG: amino acid ABC transporter permease [Rhizobiaceae bacterium]|nr:amino acid ABC transporter permease [Rhizobiaceae bacterium]